MKTSRVAVCLIFIILYFASCSRFENARRYEMCSKILAVNDTLDYMTRQWHQLLARAAWDNRFSTLHPYRLKIGQYLSRSRNEISNLDVTKDAITIKDEELAFLLARATVVSETYTRFEAFNEWTPGDVIKKEMKLVTNDVESQARAAALIKKSLKVYMHKHGLKIPK